jgi:hypothetical protein
MSDSDHPSATLSAESVIGLTTCQFAWGGLFDGRPAESPSLIHLVRTSRTGTPGPTLCGIDRFAPDAPGFSMGGGISGPDFPLAGCERCAELAEHEFAGLRIEGHHPFTMAVLRTIQVIRESPQ